MKTLHKLLTTVAVATLLSACNQTNNNSNTNTDTAKNSLEEHVQALGDKGIENMSQTQAWQNEKREFQQALGNSPSREQVNTFIQQSAANINKSLPVMVDEVTSWEKMNTGDLNIINDYQLTIDKADFGLSAQEFKNTMISQANICSTLSMYFDYDIKITYNYKDKNNTPMFTINYTKEDCAKAS